MHKVIRVIVYAETRERAFEKAKRLLSDLCGDGKEFDYFTTFDDDKSAMSGVNRWGKIGDGCEEITDDVVKKLLVEKEFKKQLSGKKWAAKGPKLTYDLVYGGMKATLEERRQGLQELRKVLCSCEAEDEIILGKVDVLRYHARQFAGDARSVYMFDDDGEMIADVQYLKDVLRKDVLRKWDNSEYSAKKIWVVPADVHF